MEDEELVALEAFRKLLPVNYKSMTECSPDIDNEVEYQLRFLRARNMDIEKAIAMYQRYHEMRTKNKDTFCEMIPSTLKHVLETGVVTKLPGTDNEGRAVFLFRFKLWNTKEMSMDQVHLACVLLLEEMSCIHEWQKKGVVMIHDYEGFDFSHFRQMTMRNFKRILQIMQGNFPLKFKAFHEVNQPYLFYILYKIFYPLVSDKLRKRVFMHGSDVNSLAAHFPANTLPEKLGGTSESYWDNEFLERLFYREPYYERLASSLF